jgi:hypothetical protein
MNRPTFLILGTSKAGTTSLHYYLSQHPEILMSDPKEPAFFRLEYQRGPEYYWRTYFRRWGGQPAVGDGCPQNLYLPYVVPRVAATVPEARLVVLCRNPVDRAASAWSHNARAGIEPLSFEAAVEKNLRRLERGPTFADESEATLYGAVYANEGNAGLQRTFGFYVEPGHYAEAIERYAAAFGRERIKILFFEDLARDPEGTTADVVRFLGLEPRPLADATVQNEATSRSAAGISATLSRIPGVSRISPVWRARVRRWIARVGRGGQPQPEISDATRRLLHEHFRPHNARLAALADRNLAAWNVPRAPVSQTKKGAARGGPPR